MGCAGDGDAHIGTLDLTDCFHQHTTRPYGRPVRLRMARFGPQVCADSFYDAEPGRDVLCGPGRGASTSRSLPWRRRCRVP
mmetsp:Transcript_20857/g.60235  ORF Transcript_20857/g.60235 Transcript_20857/m.60235 type:complete len:81 (+) Transcript_20857:3-245(+)